MASHCTAATSSSEPMFDLKRIGEIWIKISIIQMHFKCRLHNFHRFVPASVCNRLNTQGIISLNPTPHRTTDPKLIRTFFYSGYKFTVTAEGTENERSLRCRYHKIVLNSPTWDMTIVFDDNTDLLWWNNITVSSADWPLEFSVRWGSEHPTIVLETTHIGV